jgi:general secretion pathway protein D
LLRGPADVKTGAKFNVDLIIKSDGPLRGLPFQLAFDPGALEVVAVREGAFFRQGGVRTNFSTSVDPKNGRIVVGLTRSGAKGARGEDTVVTIVFRATAARGSSELRVLAATPVAAGTAAITMTLPKPMLLSVTQ